MQSKSSLLLFILFFINSLSAQNINIQDELIVCSAKNQVAENVTVYTFVYSKKEVSANPADDAYASKGNLTVQINNVLKLFKDKNEVLECSFDNATGTFTVVTSSSADLSEVIYTINQLEQ